MKKEGLGGAKGPIITIVILAILFVIVGYNFYYQSRDYSSDLITRDLATLQTIFKKIDKECRILSFDSKKNPINFLNVGSFEGSEVGSMNLAYPKQWKGPYVEKNPHVQGIEYQIVQTKKGLFITPGDGVYLPNRKTIGKDFVLNENSDIQSMMKDENSLMHKGQPLAVELKVGMNDWQKILLQEMPEDGMV